MKSDFPRRTISLSQGGTLAYFEAGSGPDLLLIHGALVTSHDMLVSLMGPLAATHHVIAIDRPGHGLSTRPRLSGSPNHQARLILEGSKALGLKRPIVVGHSLGGAVAIELALSFPSEIAAVVAISPIAFPEPRLDQILFGPRALPFFGDWAARAGWGGLDRAALPLIWRAMFLPQQIPESFAAGMAFDEVRRGPGLLANGEDAIALPPALIFNASRYAAADVPVKIIVGDSDLVVSPHLHGKPVSRMLPRGELSIVPGAGHMLHHFETDLIAKAVEQVRA
jgi:pimeloyl-ACP methyl ester carboxylesterase